MATFKLTISSTVTLAILALLCAGCGVKPTSPRGTLITSDQDTVEQSSDEQNSENEEVDSDGDGLTDSTESTFGTARKGHR